MKVKFPEIIEYGYCHCGCGERTPIAMQDSIEYKWVKGEPIRFIKNHEPAIDKKKMGYGNGLLGRESPMYGRKGKRHPNWKGGKTITRCEHTSYIKVYAPNHPSVKGKYIYEHRLIAEKVLGRYLPDGAEVHHIDGNGLNNENDNLVICQNCEYHKLLHKRKGAN
jgi:hypothetical protein